MGKKSPKINVTDYYMSIHYGVSLVVDEIREIRIDDKVAWSGMINANGSMSLSNAQFFGGDKKGGGISGRIEFMFGGDTQLFPESLLGKFDVDGDPATQANMPAYRGMTSLFFSGLSAAEIFDDLTDYQSISNLIVSKPLAGSGFKWGANNPYTPPVAVRCVKRWDWLDDDYAVIEVEGIEEDGTTHFSANPAHVIYGLCRRADGSNMAESQIDVDSFLEASETLYNESFGISVLWSREGLVEDFVRDILKHIGAVAYVDPSTGKFVLKLIRGDYDPDALPVLGKDDLVLERWSRKGFGELVTEVTVSYTNVNNRDENTVSVSDPATAAMQGEVSPGSTETYHMVVDPKIAIDLAERDLRAATTPLATGQARALRRAATLKPGSVFKLNYPEVGATNVIVRVNEIDYGKTTDEYVRIQLIEDIYGQAKSTLTRPPTTAWDNPDRAPEPLEYQAAFSLPYPLAIQVPELNLTDEDYPDTIVGLLGDLDHPDTQGFVITGPGVDAAGNESTQVFGDRPIVDRVTLLQALDQEAESSDFEIIAPDSVALEIGDLFLLGAEDEATSEFVMVEEELGAGGNGGTLYRVARGVIDTIPRAREAGTSAWHVGQAYQSWDLQPRLPDEEITYELFPYTSRGILPEDEADPLTYTPSPRAYLPHRPANVTVGGEAWDEVEYETSPSVVPVTWANRNRLMEDAVLRRWGEANVVPEEGQETYIEVINEADEVTGDHTVAGTETSFDIPISSFDTTSVFTVRVSSIRDGLVSYQGHEIIVRLLDRDGYGAFYGESYGD